jgi:hypothetical protein
MQSQVEQPPIQPQPARPPVELELGDGSKLVLEDASESPVVCRIDGAECAKISLEDALQLSGQPFAGYRRKR